MSSTIGGIPIFDMPDLGAVTDNSSMVGEHAGSGRFSMPAVNSYLGSSLSGYFLPLIGGTLSGAVTFAPAGAANTSTSHHGLILADDSVWAPPGNLSNNNYYAFLNVPSVSLSGGGTVAQKWATSNQVLEIVANPTPSMANSHTIGGAISITMPATLGDGGGGVFVGGLPTNPSYQEVGGWQSTVTALSPGHYIENIASYMNDNSGGPGVAIKMVGFVSDINKAAASDAYPSYGYQAYSSGSQQTTNAPTSAFRVDGGWQNSLDLSGNSCPTNAAIRFSADMTITNDATNIYFNASGVESMAVGGSGVEIMGEAIFNGPVVSPQLQSLPSYANDAAAAAAGVAVGQFYRNGSVVQIRVT